MNQEQLVVKARSLSERDASEFLRQLAQDERWIAVIKMVDEHREGYIVEASKQSNATHAGVQAHAMGSVFALQVLLENLSAVARPPKRRRREPDETVES